ncbi:hypothetical protein CBM2608_U80020 [Cupriavidus taiwanensis]|nr:hypothetical protein CBM2608_U80020 [Cupriavidus taiwanensis]
MSILSLSFLRLLGLVAENGPIDPDQNWIETAVAVARDVYPQGAVGGQKGLGVLAIALVVRAGRALGASRVAQVMAELSAQGAFDQGERHRSVLNRLGSHRALDEMVWDGRQLTVGGLARLGSAWHTCSLATCHGLNTKFLTDPSTRRHRQRRIADSRPELHLPVFPIDLACDGFTSATL